MDTKTRLSRIISASLSVVLLHASIAPTAWSQAVSVRVSVPATGSGAVGASSNNSALGQNSVPSLSLSGAALVPGLSAPSFTPSVSPLSSAVSAKAALVPSALQASAVPAAAVRPEASAVPEALAPVAVPLAAAKDEGAAPVASAKTPAALAPAEKTRSAASKAAAILDGARAWLTGKRAETVEAKAAAALGGGTLSAPSTPDLEPQSGGDKNGPPAPPSAPNDGGDGGGNKGWFGLGKAAAAFIGALIFAQVGVEALGAAMPALVQKTFGDFTVVAQLGIFASIAGIIGRQLGPMAVQKWGLRKTYLVGTATRIVSITALCALLATGHMTLPLMMAFYCVNGLIGGVTMTAESSIPPALIGTNQAQIEKFWTWEQTLLEIVGVTGPIVTGAVVTSFGFLPALIAFPVSFAVALAILFFTLRIPQKLEAMRLADNAKPKDPNKPSGVKGAFGQFFHRIAEGAKLVWHNPLLRTSFIAYTVYMMLNPFLYSMIAPAFGIRLVGADHMAAVYGLMTGLYSLGGLLGGFMMIREQKKLKEAKEKGGMTDAQESEALRVSMLKWMKWGVAGLLAIATLAFPVAPLSGWIALPHFLSWAGALTLPALALIPFGIAQVIATVKLRSYFQSKVPDGRMADAMGFFGSASLAVSTLGLLALKYLFKGVTGFTPFWIIAGLMIPLGIYYLRLIAQLRAQSAPPPAAPPAPPTDTH